jgi:hypothetical protein
MRRACFCSVTYASPCSSPCDTEDSTVLTLNDDDNRLFITVCFPAFAASPAALVAAIAAVGVAIAVAGAMGEGARQ